MTTAESTAQLIAQARSFLELMRSEQLIDAAAGAARLRQITHSVARTGHYAMDSAELTYACQVAWRNSSRCIGRLPWRTLTVLDRRDRESAEEIFQACVDHVRLATNSGRIRPVMSVFAADVDGRPRARIWNPQLIRYAGWRRSDGTVLGDPLHVGFTSVLEHLGWQPAERTAFTVLPVAIQVGSGRPQLFELPADAVLEVPIRHPDFPWFADLGLRWHALPMVCGMALEAGGLHYSAAPFNGWYMGTEIGARNLADTDRYDQLPAIAHGLGLSTRSSTNLWRDRALLELNVAVLHSFRADGVRIVDHHSAADQFMTHLHREEQQGRETPGDWSWLVPPMSGSTTPVFHRYYAAGEQTPGFREHPAAWALPSAAAGSVPGPFPGPFPGPIAGPVTGPIAGPVTGPIRDSTPAVRQPGVCPVTQLRREQAA